MVSKQDFRKVLAGALIAAALAGCSDPKQESIVLVTSAQEYIAKRDVRAAVIELKNALQSDSTNTQARFLLGQVHLSVGDAASAEKELRRAQEGGWNREAIQPLLLESLLRQGRHDDLLKETNNLDALPETDKANLLSMRAMSLWALKRDADAQQALTTAQAASASSPWVIQASLERALSEDRLADAKAVFEQGLAVTPTSPDLWLMKAELAKRQGAGDEQAQALAKVLESEPAGVTTAWGWQARLAQAQLKLEGEQYDAALKVLEPLAKLDPNDPRVNHLSGLISYRKGDKTAAEEKLLQVLKVAPRYPPTLLLMGPIQYDKRNYEQAVHYLSQYIIAVPENVDARKLLGRSYLALGQADEAQAILRAGMTKAQDPELVALVGLAELRRGQSAAGIRDLQQAVSADPDNLSYRFALARAHVAGGDSAGAERELNWLEQREEARLDAQKLRVLAAVKIGKLDQAQSLAQAVLDANPNDPTVVSMLASVRVAAGDREAARGLFARALELKPDYVDAAMDLARLEELDGMLPQAKAQYEAVLQIKPDASSAMLALARLAEVQGDAQLATEWLEKTQQAAPKEILPKVVLAENHLKRNELTKAEQVINELSQEQPPHPATLALQGRLFVAKGQNERALQPLQELVKVAPKAPLSHVLLAEAWIRLNKLADARNSVEKSLGLDDKFIPGLVVLANIELRESAYGRARDTAQKITKLAPDSLAGYELRGDALMALRQFGEALQAYQEGWSREKNDWLAVKLAQAMYGGDQKEQALSHLGQWLDSHPKAVRVRQEYAAYYQQLNQEQTATEQFEKVLEQDPKNVVALNNLAWMYSKRNDPRALGYAKSASDLSPDNAGVKDTYGWVLVQNGKAAEGLLLLEQAAKELKDVPEVNYHVAVAKFQLGKRDEAKLMLGALVSSGKEFEGKKDAEKVLAELTE